MSSHRDLIAWQIAQETATAIHKYADNSWKPSRAAALDQLRRASLSVVLNLVEGHACGRGPRCRFHLRIAHGSAAEVVAILEFLEGLGDPVTELKAPSRRLAAITYGLWKKS